MSYFVKINDSSGMRKRILESSKDILHVLRGYHRILDIRDEKKEMAERLKKELVEITFLIEKLEKLLPEQSLKEIEAYLPRKSKKKHASKKRSKKGESKDDPKQNSKKSREPKLTEVEKLERALSNIEDRLSKL